MSDLRALGQVIRDQRQFVVKKGLSQLADEVGITKGYLSQIERGLAKNPSKDVLEAIAEALGTELGKLYKVAGRVGEG